ncbi:O-antigen polymerase [Segatella bryantii]|jgi:oligosaccharide repeat unit polymerase|uniref:O-antigen polymerase n=1 Tax=Segatella bryantii TaxID=77095 RepID=UPI00242CBB76|nr:O-antigen ligase [Segatella bryantii]
MKKKKIITGYLVVSIVALVSTILISLTMQKKYAAFITLSDEHVENDMLLGLTAKDALVNQHKQLDCGINNPYIYCQLIYTNNFLKDIAKLHYPKTHIEDLKDSIAYKIDGKYKTIEIRTISSNATKAAIVTNSVAKLLNTYITNQKTNFYKQELAYILSIKKEKEKIYKRKEKIYSLYLDSHFDTNLKKEILKIDNLQKERDLAFNEYNNAYIQYYRTLSFLDKNRNIFTILKNTTIEETPIEPNFIPYFLTLESLGVILWTFIILIGKRLKEPTYITTKELFNPFSPWILTISIWLFILLLLQIEKGLLYPLTNKFYYSLSLWLVSFTFFSIASYYLIPNRANQAQNFASPIHVNKLFFNCLVMLLTIIAPLYFYQVLKAVLAMSTTEIMMNIRTFNIGGDKSFGILNYANIIGQALLAVAIWRYPKISGWKLTLIIVCNIISAFSIMGKMPFVFIIAIIIFALYEKKIIKIRTIALWTIPLFFLFYIFTNARQGDDEQSQLSLADFLGMYILSPPVAFGLITENIHTQFGLSTFSSIYRFINDWGLGHYEIKDGIQEFVYVPVLTNVYTILQPFYEDFGYKGVTYFGMLYGILTGTTFKLSHNGNGIAKCIYSYIAVNLILQFFQEGIFIGFIAFLEYIAICIVCIQKTIKIDTKYYDKK